ncbi:hypothetical protein [Catenovulum agarivorans]|uniref:hypothetical protein n=1 Tax=Catenovulum agarivorans TaxID=1172192 RepID=UPI0002EE98CF|nr:hypothetical protein [Catenovulum agarivorans]
MKFKFQQSAIAVALAAALAACNVSIDVNDEDDDDPQMHLKYGVFVDSPVEGVYYETDSQSGMTDSDGGFYYYDGEYITFSVGDVELPEVMAMYEITPMDLVPSATDVNDETVVNLLQFLQSLDSDGDPDNGIYIDSAAHGEFSGMVLDFTAADFDTTFAASLANLNLILVDAQDAIDHFVNGGYYPPMHSMDKGLDGSWIFVETDDAGNDVGRHVLTFIEGNRYILSHETDDQEGNDQVAGSVEFAKYEIDEHGQFHVVQVIEASDGDGGLENEGRPNEQFFSYNDMGQLELKMREAPELPDGQWDTDKNNWGDYNVLTFENAFSSTNAMTGSWILQDMDDSGMPVADSYHVITLFGGGEYSVAHTMNQEAYGDDMAVAASSEWGSYTMDDNGFMINTPHVDLDGPGGLYDADNIDGNIQDISLTADGSLEITEDGDSFTVMPVFSMKVLMDADVMGSIVFHTNPGMGGDLEFVDVFTFNSDGTGSFYWMDDPDEVENFDWEINGMYQLEIETELGSIGQYTLVAGNLNAGYLMGMWDEDGDGHFEYANDIVVTYTQTQSLLGDILFSYGDNEGTGHFSFMDDGTGSVMWDSDPNDIEGFMWMFTDNGELQIDLADAAGLPDIYTIVSGTFMDGELSAQIDDDENGSYEVIDLKVVATPSTSAAAN